MTNDDFRNRIENIDRSIKQTLRRLAQRSEEEKRADEEWAEGIYQNWLRKHDAYLQDLKDRRVAADELFADVFGTRSYECLEAETLKNSGIIPPWRPYPNPSEKGG